MNRRILAIVVAVLMAGVMLASCGSAATSTATRPGAPVIAPAGDPVRPSLKPCSTDQLTVRRITSNGTAGTIYLEVLLATKANLRCTLRGYPDASLYGKRDQVDATLSELPKREPVTGTPPLGTAPKKLGIGPGAANPVAFYLGVAQVETDNVPCERAEGLEYKTPGSDIYSGELPFSAVLTACPPTLFVSAFERPAPPN